MMVAMNVVHSTWLGKLSSTCILIYILDDFTSQFCADKESLAREVSPSSQYLHVSTQNQLTGEWSSKLSMQNLSRIFPQLAFNKVV